MNQTACVTKSKPLCGQMSASTFLRVQGRVICAIALSLFCRYASAADFVFSETATDLGDPVSYGGSLPTESDTIVIDAGARTNGTLDLSADLSVAGILITNYTQDVGINAGKTLSIGAGGITVQNRSGERVLNLRVALNLTADQTWNLGGCSFNTSDSCGSWGGTAALTIASASTVQHSAPLEYAGPITYASSVGMLYYTRNGKWADSLPTFNITTSGGWIRFKAQENLTWATIFPYSVSVAKSFTLEKNVAITGYKGKTLTFADGDSLTARKSDKSGKLALDCGTFNQTGGTVDADYLQVARELYPSCWHISGGSAIGTRVTISALQAVDHVSSFRRNPFAYLPHTFWQENGDVTIDTLEMNWYGGGNFQIPVEYRLEGGTLTVNDKNDADNAIHCATFRTTTGGASASGSFLQGGGVLNTPGFLLGATSTNVFGKYGSASEVSALIGLTNGTMNVGAGGFAAGKGWVGSPSNSNYRVNLRGGTIRATDDFSSELEMTIVNSGDTVTFDTDGHAVALMAPVSGHGKLRKTGNGTLSIYDASSFRGEFAVEGGTVALAGVPTVAAVPSGCVRWTADDACATLANGAEVTTWTANTGAAAQWKALSNVTPAKPTAVLSAFNGHAALDFNGAALAVTAANDPLVGKNKWTIAVVFKGNAGYTDSSGGNTAFYRHAGLLGNEISGVGRGDWAIALASNGKLCAGLGVSSSGGDYTLWSDLPFRRNLKDDRPHVAIYSAGGTSVALNVDGITSSYTTASAIANRASISSDVSFLIGASQNSANTLVRGFNGKIAEIRIYPGTKMDAASVSALGAELAATYGAADGWKFACDSVEVMAGDIPATAAPSATEPSDGATVWEADTLDAADGASVSQWPAKTDSEKVATLSAAGISSAHAPTLVKDAINGCAALRFSTDDKNTLGIPGASSPVAGSVNYSMVVVFRAKRDGINAESSHAFNGLGLLSTEIGGSDQKDTILGFMDRGRVACTYGGYGLAQRNYLSYGVRDKASADQSLYAPVYGMNDGEAHCVIASVDGTNSNLWMMADGAWKHAKIESAQAERHSTKRMLIGGISESGDSSARFFDGDIAAIRLYNKALSVEEMNAVTDYYAAKYGIRRAPTVGVDSASVSGYGLAATSITVTADATLRLPSGETSPFKIGAGQSISGGGAVQGTLGVAADGALAMGSEGLTVDDLRLDSGARIILTEAFARDPDAISAGALTASGTVNVEFGDGVDISSFGTERLPLISVASAPSLAGGTASWSCEKGRVALVGNTVYYTPAIGLVISIR